MSTIGNRGRVIGAVALIVLGLLQIFNNSVTGNVMDYVWTAAFVLAAVGFGWVYARERETWAAIVGYVSGAIGLILVLSLFNAENLLMPELVLMMIGVPFVFAWYNDRKQWGYLVPAYIMGALTLMFLILGEDSSFIPSFVLIAIGLPFVVGWFFNRAQWGLLVPAYVMLSIAAMFLFIGEDSELVPVYVMAVIGLPFILAAIITRKWPFLIPGGIMLLIAVGLAADLSEVTMNTLSIVFALGMIGGGLYLLWESRRHEDEPLLKRKHE